MKIFHKITGLIFLLFLISLKISYSQETAISEFEYISPVPGSGMNTPETNIIIRYGPAYNSNDVYSKKLIEVEGNISGLHSGEIILAEKNKTLLFNPDIPFQEGEVVTVRFLRSTKTEDDQVIPAFSFFFKITENNLNEIVKHNPKKYLLNEYSELEGLNSKNYLSPLSNNYRYSVMDDSLPEDFPSIEIDSINNPAPGFIFLTPFDYINRGKNYLVIMNNYGIPVFYRQMHYLNYDFKKQPTGVLTFYDELVNKFFVLDSSYNQIDSLFTKNGYLTDVHELVITEDNHSLMMSYDFQTVAMDTVVPGGNPNATVIGLIIQEQDENKNVVFQWRSWDHFKITDATFNIDLMDSLIDYVHGNAIEVDYDGNLLISSRHMDEVTKINRQTGNLIWRLGGEYCDNNQFTFINDPIGFSHQHDIRRLNNGNITVFDNGNLHSPPFSRVVEYQLDEVNKLSFLVWEYRNNPASISFAMGSARRLSNHNTIIGWGTGTSPAISEVKPNGEVALFLSIPDTIFNYRGFKYPWKTNLFVGNPESLFFGYVPLNDSLELQLELTNNSDQQIEINSIYNRDSAYIVFESLPIAIAPFGTTTITIKFKPEVDKDYFDDLHLRWDTEGQRIAQIIPLIGSTDPNFTSIDPENGLMEYNLSQNYPNPFNPTTTIAYQIPQTEFVSLKVYDILGREVVTLVDERQAQGRYAVKLDGRNLASGVYFYRLQAHDFVSVNKMLLLK